MARPRTIRPPAIAGGLLLAVAGGLLSPPPASAEDPFADAVHALELGTNGGFGSELLPDIVLGPPRGTGLTQGSFDVLALGDGGEIVLRFDEPFICDGPGVDFTVFENAFHSGGSVAGAIFDELGYIAVSQDGVTFFELPFDRVALTGLAGQTPVESNPDNGIDPTDPTVSGGDSFDLADVGLAWASYVRITDVGGDIPDVGDLPPFLPPPNAGFDLDAVAAVHTCPPQSDDTPYPDRKRNTSTDDSERAAHTELDLHRHRRATQCHRFGDTERDPDLHQHPGERDPASVDGRRCRRRRRRHRRRRALADCRNLRRRRTASRRGSGGIGRLGRECRRQRRLRDQRG